METIITAHGHPEVRGTHESTLEFTTDDYLTPAGECIVGIEADTAPADMDETFKAACKAPGASIRATLEVDGMRQTLTGSGAPELTFASDRSAVIRTSQYIDDRTIMVGADRAAADLDREMIEVLREEATIKVTLSVEP